MATEHVPQGLSKAPLGAGLATVASSGFLMFAKEMGWGLPFWLVAVIGIISIIALVVFALSGAFWAWRTAKEQWRDQDSAFNIFVSGVRRNLIPLMIGTMAVAGALLIIGAILSAIAYSNTPPALTQDDINKATASIQAELDETKKKLETANATPLPTPKKSDNPLINAINAFLAKSGKAANYAPIGGTVMMQDDSDGKGPFITKWDSSLGAWPTTADGFTVEQLRRSPTLQVINFPKGNQYDVGIKLPLLDSLSIILRDEMEPLFKEGRRLQTNWWNALKDRKNNPNYNAVLSAFRDKIKENYDKLEAIKNKHPQYGDISFLLNQTYFEKLFKSAEKFMIHVGVFHTYMNMDISYETLSPIMRDDSVAFEKSLNEYNEWISKTQKAVVSRRTQLAE